MRKHALPAVSRNQRFTAEKHRLSPFAPSQPKTKPTRKRLALWSSTISAKALTAYLEKQRAVSSIHEVKMMSFSELEFIDPNTLRDWEISLMGVYVKDSISPRALEVLKILSKNQSAPITVCHCGTANTDSEKKWREVIRQLSSRCKIRINYYENEIFRGEFDLNHKPASLLR